MAPSLRESCCSAYAWSVERHCRDQCLIAGGSVSRCEGDVWVHCPEELAAGDGCVVSSAATPGAE
jgi:hypothetical protein